MKNKSFVKHFIMVASGLIICLLICVLGIWLYSSSKWKQGIYVYEGIADVACYEEQVRFDVGAIIVGEKNLKQLENGRADVYLVNDAGSHKVSYQLIYYVEEKHYYEGNLRITPEYKTGEYSFDEIVIKDEDNIIARSNMDINIRVIPQNTLETVHIQNTMNTYQRKEHHIDFYIGNSGEDTISIDSLKIKGAFPKGTVIEYITDIPEEKNSVAGKEKKKLDSSFLLAGNSNAYVAVTIPIEENSLEWQYYLPMLQVTVDGEKYNLGMFHITSAPFRSPTAEKVLEYINQ